MTISITATSPPEVNVTAAAQAPVTISATTPPAITITLSQGDPVPLDGAIIVPDTPARSSFGYLVVATGTNDYIED